MHFFYVTLMTLVFDLFSAYNKRNAFFDHNQAWINLNEVGRRGFQWMQILGLLACMYFYAAVAFVMKLSILFRLPLAIL